MLESVYFLRNVPGLPIPAPGSDSKLDTIQQEPKETQGPRISSPSEFSHRTKLLHYTPSQGHVSQTSSVLHRKWLCPGGITSGDILLSISGTHKKGSEGKKELSGYFLVEISVVTHLLKTHYLKGKCTYTQLLHSQYNPFQISVVFHCVKFRVFYTTVPLKTVHMKSN